MARSAVFVGLAAALGALLGIAVPLARGSRADDCARIARAVARHLDEVPRADAPLPVDPLAGARALEQASAAFASLARDVPAVRGERPRAAVRMISELSIELSAALLEASRGVAAADSRAIEAQRRIADAREALGVALGQVGALCRP